MEELHPYHLQEYPALRHQPEALTRAAHAWNQRKATRHEALLSGGQPEAAGGDE